MAEEKLLTVREVSVILGVSEKEVLDLAQDGVIPAYKVGGVYLRFKRDQIDEYRRRIMPSAAKHQHESNYPIKEKIGDFFYFNDFYIFSFLIIGLILLVIFRG